MPMLRKSGLSQLMKFKEFINKQGGDISKKLNDKSVTNTLDKHIDVSDDEPGGKTDKQLKNLSKKSIINKANERYLNDEEIAAGYKDFKIISFNVKNILDYVSGSIEIEFPDGEGSWFYIFDNWIRYKPGKFGFDHWYPEEVSKKIKKYINEGIEKERLKRDAKKYNL